MSAITSQFHHQGSFVSEQCEAEETFETQSHSSAEHQSSKPYLTPPLSFGQIPTVFNLFDLFIKIAIHTESEGYFFTRQDMMATDKEERELWTKEVEKRKEAAEKEKQANRWGVLAKVASWFSSILSIVVGSALVFTGVGAIAGSLMIAGGVVSTGSQVMETTGGWEKIKDRLPGDDSAKKAAVCTWIQIGVSILSLILSGAGVLFGGGMTDLMSNSFQTIIIGFTGASKGAEGVASIGTGITKFMFNNSMSEIKEIEIQIAQVTFHREDAMKSLEDQLEYLMQNFQFIAQSFKWMENIHQAEQRNFMRS